MLILLGGVLLVLWQSEDTAEQAVPTVWRGKPELPVEVVYRQAIMGPGLVVGLKNTSDRNLAVLLTVANRTTKEEMSFRVDLPPKGSSELGHMEGWTFASGDSVKIVHADYRPFQGQLP
jgi:hypothetical protein